MNIQSTKYKQKILINYSLDELSNKKFYTVDRGPDTDRYETTLSIKGTKEYIDELVNELQILRDNKKPVILTDMEEPIFGDNVKHDIDISTLVYKIDNKGSSKYKVYNIELTLLATDLFFEGQSDIPEGMKCLGHDWKGISIWNTHINETYNRNNYFVDREADTFLFTGNYLLSKEDNQMLLNWHKHNRGYNIYITEDQFGVIKMFGPNGGDTDHTVVIKQITYERVSPIHRKTKIELYKVV